MPDSEDYNLYTSEFPRLKKKWFKRPLVYIFIIVAVGIGYFSFKLGLAYNSISIDNGPWWKGLANVLDIGGGKDYKMADDQNPLPEPEKNRLDVLILGIRGENDTENGGLLTDTIMVLSFDKETKSAALISVPRDLYIDMVARGPAGKEIRIKGKINEVYERGLANKDGLQLVKQIVSKVTGIYIDKAVVFDFRAFQTIVEALGGIDITLAQPFSESTQWGYNFSLPAGQNHINGEQALYYVRSRYSTSDFDRARRQQSVIAAIKNKVFSLGFLSNPAKITSLFSNLSSDIKTDFQIWDMRDLIALAGSMNTKDAIKNYFMTTDNLLYQTKTENGEYILLPKNGNFNGIRDFFKNILTSPQ